MNGFVNIVNGFSQAAIDALVVKAEDLYTGGSGGWTPTPLPDTLFNVLDYGLVGNGSTDDTAALEAMQTNPAVTNLYFPTGSTFRLSKVDIDPSIVAMSGGGTIKFHDEGNSNTELDLWGFGFYGLVDNFVIDGLNFELESGYTTRQNYGMLTFWASSGGVSNGLEVRNCTSNGANGKLNFIKLYTDLATGRKFNDARFYNNESYNCGGFFDFEMIDLTTDAMNDGMPNFKLYNNHIHDGYSTHGGISYIKMNSEGAEIYNNLIEQSGMAIEILSRNVDVHHNKLMAIDGQAFSVGEYTSEYGDVIPTSETYIRNNHVELLDAEAYVFSYSGGNSQFYENYISGRVILRLDVAGSQLVVPDFHDNTVVAPFPNTGVHISNNIGGGNIDGGSCYNNEVYGYAGWTCIVVGNTPATTNTGDNDMYIVNGTGTCETTSGTTQNNTCTENYNGAVPTDRAGAGLSDPANIGPQ